MSKRGLFIASITAGLVAFGAVAFMQLDPRSFTNEPRVDLDSYACPAAPHEVTVKSATMPLLVAKPEVENATLFASTVYIFGDATRAPQRATRQPPSPVAPAVVPAIPMEPCSPWRDVGPTNVDEGVPSGTVRVRDLC